MLRVFMLSLCLVIAAATAAVAQPPAEEPASPAAKSGNSSDDASTDSSLGQFSLLRSHIEELYSPPMIPLWLCSLALLTLIFERLVALRRGRIVDSSMTTKVAELVGQRRMTEAHETAERSKTVVGRAWAQGIHEFLLGGVSIEESLTNATALAFKPLKRNLQGITTISVISPLLGLLGTVIGMIMVFDQISIEANPDKQAMASGIMVALFTTVFGLIIAIPGIVCGRYFASRVRGFAETVETDIDRVRYRHVHATATQTPAASKESS